MNDDIQAGLFADIDTLVNDLTQAGLFAGVRALPVMHRGANNIVREARELAPKSAVAKHYPATITYDIDVEPGAIVAEIGPDREKNGQAKLGNIFEYGTSELPPRAHLGPSLDREGPNLERYLADIAGRWL